ncbi:hypothetical protein RJT34_32908 [Clitoria ternatea]|uniref:Uncharacterized protein n=1 Tax=Clitoria ternatea TaxID=43366 RepID=A0AAN9F145_CLITE
MASNSQNHNKNNIKIHEHCKVPPPSSTPTSSLPLTFFDTLWVRFHPVERIFFYSLQTPLSDPSHFFRKVLPDLKTSLSLTLQHFSPLAGNIVWPSDSSKPIIQYNPGDAVSVFIAESDTDFDHVLDNSPKEAENSRLLLPHLESSDSLASVLSLQITLFPNRGFCIGIATHHAVFDGKSSTLFIKAWASLCQSLTNGESLLPSSTLVSKFEPFLDRSVIKDPSEMGLNSTPSWTELMMELFPGESTEKRCLKILPFHPKLEDKVRATFLLTRGDLEKIKKRVLSKWDIVEQERNHSSKPPNLSSFVLACAHTLVCIAKAIHGIEKDKEKFGFAFTVDCRSRLEPPIPDNYFGNCVWGLFVDTEPLDFIKEEGLVIVAKSIHSTIKMMDEKGIFHRYDMLNRFIDMAKDGVQIMGVAGSNRFGVYGIDFGWGRPSKVEITSVDRSLGIGLAEGRDGGGGIEVGIVLNKRVMDLFDTLFRRGLCDAK